MNSQTTFFNIDWIQKAEKAETPIWKEFIYRLLDPLETWQAKKYFNAQQLRDLPITDIRQERGFTLNRKRQWACEFLQPIRDKNMLIQGTGTGWDVLGWASLRPKSVHAIDLYPFDEWPAIVEYCQKRYQVPVTFQSVDLENLECFTKNSFDLIVSDAVYEHCKNFTAVMQQTFRILKPGGWVYASYGPLWHCAGGDHFSGRAGLANSFNHLLLDTKAYQAFYQAHKKPQEDFQDGGRYVELDLFSKLTTQDYAKIYQQVGFSIHDLVIESSNLARQFQRQFPQQIQQILQRHPSINSNDLLIKANYIRLYKSI